MYSEFTLIFNEVTKCLERKLSKESQNPDSVILFHAVGDFWYAYEESAYVVARHFPFSELFLISGTHSHHSAVCIVQISICPKGFSHMISYEKKTDERILQIWKAGIKREIPFTFFQNDSLAHKRGSSK